MLRLVTSGDPYEAPGKSDFLLAVDVLDGDELVRLADETIDAGDPPSADNLRTLTYDLADFAGETVGIVLTISYGGPNGTMNDEAFFDEISVVVDDTA